MHIVHRSILLPTVLTLGLLLPHAAPGVEYMMAPVQERMLEAGEAYRSHQVIDFDSDGFDDVAVLYLDRLVVYSPANDTILWTVTGSEFTGLVLDCETPSERQAYIFTCNRDLKRFLYPNAAAVDSLHLSNPVAGDAACARTDLAIRDLGSNGTNEITVTQRVGRSFLCRLTGGVETFNNIFTFSLASLAEIEFYDHYQFQSDWSDSVALEADLDGDGLRETIGFGRHVRGGCESLDGIPTYPFTYDSWDLVVYNQLGQIIAYETDGHGVAATVADFDPTNPGDECVARVEDTQYTGRIFSADEPHHLFSFKIANAQFVTLWSREAGEYGLEFLQLPAFPHTFGLEHESGLAWHIFDGSDGSLTHALYGLQPHTLTLGGHFSPAADTGIQIVQISGDTITLYGTAVPTDVDDGTGLNLPTGFVLHPNYPNPFNPATEIRFELPRISKVTLEVFAITGQRVAVLIDRVLAAGEHTTTWDASAAASGVYLYRLTAGETTLARKMMLLK